MNKFEMNLIIVMVKLQVNFMMMMDMLQVNYFIKMLSSTSDCIIFLYLGMAFFFDDLFDNDDDCDL